MAIRTKQLAPFNLTDGAWLRNIGTTGPIDNVRALLYSVAMDELGDGEVSQNHCNLYRDLCHQVGRGCSVRRRPAVVGRWFAGASRNRAPAGFVGPTGELSGGSARAGEGRTSFGGDNTVPR